MYLRPRHLAIAVLLAAVLVSSRQASAQFTPDVPTGGTLPTSAVLGLEPADEVTLQSSGVKTLTSRMSLGSMIEAWSYSLPNHWFAARTVAPAAARRWWN